MQWPVYHGCLAKILTQIQYLSSSLLSPWGLLLCFCSSKLYLHFPNESDMLTLFGRQLIFTCYYALMYMVVLVWCGLFNLSNFHNDFSQQQQQVSAPKELEFARKTVTN